jgi:hypothetical protein
MWHVVFLCVSVSSLDAANSHEIINTFEHPLSRSTPVEEQSFQLSKLATPIKMSVPQIQTDEEYSSISGGRFTLLDQAVMYIIQAMAQGLNLHHAQSPEPWLVGH